MLVIGGILVITQVASVCAMDLALADGDDERNQELVVRNGQGDARLHLVIGEVLLKLWHILVPDSQLLFSVLLL